MCDNETGLLTVAFHVCLGRLFPSRIWISGSEPGSIHGRVRTSVRESQLRGSGGISPRFPSISLRYKVDSDGTNPLRAGRSQVWNIVFSLLHAEG